MWRQFGFGEHCRLVETEHITRFETPIGQLPYNAVTRFDAASGADDLIDDALRAYQARRVPVMWVVHPSTHPADLDRLLARRGLRCAEVIPGMVRDLDRLPDCDSAPDGVAIVEVRQRDQHLYLDLLRRRYGLPRHAIRTVRSVYRAAGFGEPGPPNRSWIAVSNGRALAKVALHDVDGIAGIYGVATAPEARRQGLARTLTLTALAAARDNGAHLAVLHSSPIAAGMYCHLGFQHVADFRLFTPPGALHL